VPFARFYYGEKSGGGCGTLRRGEKFMENFGKKKLKVRDHLVDLGIDVS
jgi:hypothetical protein